MSLEGNDALGYENQGFGKLGQVDVNGTRAQGMSEHLHRSGVQKLGLRDLLNVLYIQKVRQRQFFVDSI